MNARELDSGTMSIGTQFMWMFVLSSVVITLSLAIAFNAQARGLVFGAFEAGFSFLARPVKGKKNDSSHLAAASPHVIREFMITKQKEWEGTDGNGTSTGSLPLHRNQEPKMGVTARLTRMWRRESV